jgi:dolichol-phosphate mannosyltransferase
MTARTLIVVPTYNESGNIPELIRKIFANLPEVHLLVVDDDSPDGTAGLVEKIATSQSASNTVWTTASISSARWTPI